MNFEIWGLTGSLTTERDAQMREATSRLWHWIDAVDASCNRFRGDSELSRINQSRGATNAVSPTLELAIEAALRAADVTDNLVDPTVLPALIALGYDRDYDELITDGAVTALDAVPAPGPTAIHLDRDEHTVTLDPSCQLDLGASAKALVADLVADDVAPSGGVVVELGGDVAVRGEGPDGPWTIGVSDSLLVAGNEPRVAFRHGGIATSSTTSRTWQVGGRTVNHIVDPRTGTCAQGLYTTATVSASDCVLANAFATAALLWDGEAGYHIAQAGWSARLVRRDGSVEFVGGWPEESR
ncbi:MAG: FAD:protein FMN transferase [Acidimicrobiales bacterium]